MTSRQNKQFTIGIAGIGLGAVVLAVGVLIAHFTGLPDQDAVGREIYPSVPRGWALVLVGEAIALGGVLLAMAGAAVAFLWGREMTWARAALGALLFTGLMIILFGIVPNQWLNLTQGPLDWNSRRIWLTVPSWLVLGNEVRISAAAVKDIVSGTYAVVALAAVVVAIYQWQEWKKRRAAGPPPQPVSTYGRPMTRAQRSPAER
ncbi:MAG TPA: hypothetical protein VGC11_16635 [Acidimicrobiia bacterium]|jgi:hypothetical protein